jgi:hypothetical protein
LEVIHSGLQLDQLGTKRHLVESLLDTVKALFDALQPAAIMWYSVSSRSKRW